jgi:hypothetical protein
MTTTRTNVVLDDDLVQEAARLSGIRTKRALVHEALRFFIAAKKRKSLLDLEGKIELAPGYDHKALRPRPGGEVPPSDGITAGANTAHEPRRAHHRRRTGKAATTP